MIRKLMYWYKSLMPLKQLLINFIATWLIWFIGGIVFDKWILENARSIRYEVFNAIGMALWICIFLYWKKVKTVFSKSRKETTH